MARPRTKAKRLQVGIDSNLSGWIEWQGRTHPQGQAGYLNDLAQIDRAAMVTDDTTAKRYKLYLEACGYDEELEGMGSGSARWTGSNEHGTAAWYAEHMGDAGRIVGNHYGNPTDGDRIRAMVAEVCGIDGNHPAAHLVDGFSGDVVRMLDSMELLGINWDVRVRAVAAALATFTEEVAPTVAG